MSITTNDVLDWLFWRDSCEYKEMHKYPYFMDREKLPEEFEIEDQFGEDNIERVQAIVDKVWEQHLEACEYELMEIDQERAYKEELTLYSKRGY